MSVISYIFSTIRNLPVSTADLAEKTSSTTPSEVDIHVMIFPINGLFDERLLNDLTIDNDGISIFTQDDLFTARDLAVLFVPVTVPSSALHPTLWDIGRTPGVFTLTERSREDKSEIPPHPLSKSSIDTRSTVSGNLGSGRSRHADVIQDSEDESTVPEQGLHGERVDTNRRRTGRIGKLRISNGLGKGKVGRKERDKDVDGRPVGDVCEQRNRSSIHIPGTWT
jgi:hypothetical protein